MLIELSHSYQTSQVNVVVTCTVCKFYRAPIPVGELCVSGNQTQLHVFSVIECMYMGKLVLGPLCLLLHVCLVVCSDLSISWFVVAYHNVCTQLGW